MGARALASAPMESGWWPEIPGPGSGKSAPGARSGRSRTSVATFSPDSRLVVVVEPNQVLRLVELETGRTLARLESPDLCSVAAVAFSPDGSRLVVTTKDRPTPAVHVWDLRAIRKDLAGMGLDWDAPAYSEDDLANPSASPLPPLQVDFGNAGPAPRAFHRAPDGAASSVIPRGSRAIPTMPTPITIALTPWPN